MFPAAFICVFSVVGQDGSGCAGDALLSSVVFPHSSRLDLQAKSCLSPPLPPTAGPILAADGGYYFLGG